MTKKTKHHKLFTKHKQQPNGTKVSETGYQLFPQ